MRIALFSDNFYPELSGISDSIISLAKQLAARGHVINFYVPQYVEKNYASVHLPFKELDLGPNIEIHRFYSLPFAMGTGQGRVVPPFGTRVSEIAQFKPDVLHSQLFFGVGLEAMFASWMLKKPLVGTQHTAVKEFLKYSPIQSGWSDAMILDYVNWYYEHCDFVTAPSQSVFDEMATAGFKAPASQVISNPIDTNTFHPLGDSTELKKKFGFNEATIVHAGRLSDERNPDILIKALPIIKKMVPNAILAFAGKGTSDGKLAALAAKLGVKDSVKFLGFVDKPTLNEIYNASEVFAIASTGDTQSLVMMQAMASGIPVVGVRARALPEYINEKNGFVVEPNDENAMAGKIIEILKDPAMAKRLGAGARTYAEQFSEAHIAEQWEAIYTKVIANY